MQISTENCSSDADLRQSAAAQSESVDIIDFARAPSGTDAKHSYKTPTDNSKITCEVSGCNRRLKKAYHKRCRLCPQHMKSSEVSINGMFLRFCQKCSKLHQLALFDGDKRSCRVGLEKHNVRQRMLRAMKSSGSKDSMPHDTSGINSSSDVSEDAAENFQAQHTASIFPMDTYSVQAPAAGFYPAIQAAHANPGPALLGMGCWPIAMPPGLPLDFADKIIDDFIMEFSLANSGLLESVGDIAALPPVVQLPSSFN